MAIEYKKLSENIRASVFESNVGLSEINIVIESQPRDRFEKAISDLILDYKWALKELGLTENTSIFSRLYLSDIINQLPLLETTEFRELFAGRLSLVEQRPLMDNEMILLAYHVASPDSSPIETKNIYVNEQALATETSTKNYKVIWGTNFSNSNTFDAYEQTSEIFESYNNILNTSGMTMLNSSVRTWLYVRDIDNHYAGVVESRKLYFETHGLTRDTRYIASTGIEGKMSIPPILVSMDFLNIYPLKEEQIIRMEALEHLGPTIDYGVTFERGTQIMFGDRSHLYISGTASIDPSGQVVYLQDAYKQTLRAIENLSALLQEKDCSLNDVSYFIIYARNPADKQRITDGLLQSLPNNVPYIFVVGAVCRPTWLVEIECVAIRTEQTEFLPFM